MNMTWTVILHDEFEPEFDELPEEVQDKIAAHVELLEKFGPALSRPRADTLQGSQHSNMKELRLNANDGVWRIAFAFDPLRQAVLLVAGDKSGVNQKRFYRRLIAQADQRFSDYLENLRTEGER